MPLPSLTFALAFALLFSMRSASAEPQPEALEDLLVPIPVTESLYYFKGSINQRTYENQGFNLNTGFVVTDAGVVVIDTGPSILVARGIEAAIGTVTEQPIVAAINTGSQDHRWLGNGYFADQGIPIIASYRTVHTQQEHAASQVQRLQEILGESFADTRPVHASDPVTEDHHRFTVGSAEFALIYGGDAHFPGDVMVWLPQHRVVFSGDIVYLDRLTGIHPWSSVLGLQQAFQTLEALDPEIVVPGHGYLGDLDQARAQTGDYYDFLIEEIQASLENWEDLGTTVDRLADAPQFRELLHYEFWHRVNVNHSYLQLETSP